jgi:hypothetical protein
MKPGPVSDLIYDMNARQLTPADFSGPEIDERPRETSEGWHPVASGILMCHRAVLDFPYGS